MKIIQVNCVYPYGSTGKIVEDINKELENKNIESIICYGRGEKINKKNVYKTCSEFYSHLNNIYSRLTGYMYGGCLLSTKKLINIIKKEKPNVVHLHCINGYFVNIYKLLTWLKNNNIYTVLTLHAEFMYTANCGYAYDCEKWKTGCGNCPRLREETKSLFIDNTSSSWKKMKSAFEGFDNLFVVSVSPWLMNRAKKSPILKDSRHKVILNGIDTNIFKKYDTSYLKKEMNLSSYKIIFHSTAYFSAEKNHRKGGYYVLKIAERLKNDNVKIVIAGDYDKEIDKPDNVIFLGKISNQEELAKLYSMADLFLITSKRETFSMPVAESLCCGTPVVGFKAGAPEQISIKEYSEFINFGDIDELLKVIYKYLNIPKDDKISDISIKKYSKETMAREYLELYKKN